MSLGQDMNLFCPLQSTDSFLIPDLALSLTIVCIICFDLQVQQPALIYPGAYRSISIELKVWLPPHPCSSVCWTVSNSMQYLFFKQILFIVCMKRLMGFRCFV